MASFHVRDVACMLWVTRHEPHVDRCASAWLIKRFIDKEASFQFIDREDEIPKGAIGFTLPKAGIKPVEGTKTTFDALIEKYKVKDAVVSKIREIIRDCEFNEDEPERMRLKETLGVSLILKGLTEVSATDEETITRASVVMDALYASLQDIG
jgi:hypothetical protein